MASQFLTAVTTERRVGQLVDCITPDCFYCIWCSIRHLTVEVGAAVLRAAVAEELAEGHCDVGPKELMNMSKVRTDIQSSFHKIQKLFLKHSQNV